MNKPRLSGQLAEAICREFPHAPSIQLARVLCKDNPAVFLTVEDARSAVRYQRGATGEQARIKIERVGRLVERLDLPDPEPSHFKVYTLPPEPHRWLVLADLHVPFHEPEAVRIALRYGKKAKCDGLLFLGDLCDFYQLSHWLKDPRRRDFVSELDTVEEVILIAQEYLKPKDTVWKASNHEYRLDRYLMARAPELFGIKEFLISDHLQFQKRNITWVPRGCPIQHHELTILHGDEWQSGMTSPVNPARTAFLKALSCTLTGHQHRTSEHNEPTVTGVNIACFSVGCLCNLHQEYAPLNKWNHGGAILDVSDKWHIQNFRIINGTIV